MSTKVTLTAIAKRLDKIETSLKTPVAAPQVIVVHASDCEARPICPMPEPLEWHSVADRLPHIPASVHSYDRPALLVLKNANGTMSTGTFYEGRYSRRFEFISRHYKTPVIWWAYQDPSAARAAGCR